MTTLVSVNLHDFPASGEPDELKLLLMTNILDVDIKKPYKYNSFYCSVLSVTTT